MGSGTGHVVTKDTCQFPKIQQAQSARRTKTELHQHRVMTTNTKTSLAIAPSIRGEEVYAGYGVRDETSLHHAIGAVFQTSFGELAYSDAYKRSAAPRCCAAMRSAARARVANPDN